MHHILKDIKLFKLSNLWITTVIADKYEYNDIKDDSLISLISLMSDINQSLWRVCVKSAAQLFGLVRIPLCGLFNFRAIFQRDRTVWCVFSGPGSTTVFVARG